MPDICNNCRHYRGDQCRRYPQSVRVPADYGCGEYVAATIRPAGFAAPPAPLVSLPVAVAPSVQPSKRGGKRQQ